MLIAICAAVLVGALLGLRFKVFILVPATILAVGAAKGQPAMFIFVTTFLFCAALWLSYLAGAFIAVAPVSRLELWILADISKLWGRMVSTLGSSTTSRMPNA